MTEPHPASKTGLEWLDLVLEPTAEAGFVDARIIPARAMMLLQARVRLANGEVVDVLFSPTPAEAANALDGGPQDFMGNASFSFGAAILAPYANRIRGVHSAADRTVEAWIHDRRLKLPANGGGKAPGAEQYAIHGLILARPAEEVRIERGLGFVEASGLIRAGDFGVGWPSSTEIEITWRLEPTALSLSAVARNTGSEETPIGFGWHPYFALPSGQHDQARMRLPARSRIAVNDYDEVLPTGEVLPVAGTAFDFRAPVGAPLGDRHLDDCFADLDKTAAGETVCEVIDPAAHYGLRIVASSPEISAIQIFTEPGRPFVVVEPQFNLADPYGAEWPRERSTGMVLLRPGGSVAYDVRLEMFVP